MAEFLSQLLRQSAGIRELVREAAEELSTVGVASQHLAGGDPLTTGVGGKEPSIITKLHDAFEGLMAVDQALQAEIRDRAMVDHQLAAALEQKEGARLAALHDPLTALPNRMLFRDRLEHALAQAQRQQWILAVIFIDLDNFKSINDTHGHQAGDTVLQAIATRLSKNTREEDTLCRYGGDEFLCLLTPLPEEKAIAMIAAKILKAIQAPFDLQVGGHTVNLHLDASIGISMFPRNGVTADELIARADGAMYTAKDNQRGIVFSQHEVAPAESGMPHRLADRYGIKLPNGAACISDGKSTANNQSLPGKSRQAIRAR